ncbi:MAG: EpsI family protein [Candidatus Hydrogenedentes bacterium]|nr:EpsI family protein [Candidatus Hydrogenedentota bacterium]
MKRYLILIAMLSAIAIVYFLLVRTQNEAVYAAPAVDLIAVPQQIGPYVQAGNDLDVGDRVRTYLETSRILVRRYSAPSGRPIELTIVHAAVTRRSLHFPEICLIGEGWDIREQGIQPIGVLFTAKRLVLVRGAEREAVIYWFQTGTRLTANYFLNAWHWARDQVCFRSPVSAMIRLSTPLGNQNETAAFSALVDFAMKLAPLMQEYGRPQEQVRRKQGAAQKPEARSSC